MVITTLLLAANCNSLIKSIQTRIYQSLSTQLKPCPNCNGDSFQFRITLLMNQVNTNQFGISGHFFVITYGYVGTVCGLVITYALVVSQLRDS
ncbi:unnamed protein product [Allacma fusca]|nr:unnamed protein product [Allacma fusca]